MRQSSDSMAEFDKMRPARTNNLQEALNKVPPGFIVDSRWIDQHGGTTGEIASLVANGDLTAVAPSVYRRQCEPAPHEVDWRILAISLHRIMGYPVHVGGDTALSEQGIEHYVRFRGYGQVWFYAPRFPTWVQQVPIAPRLRRRSAAVFTDPGVGLDGAAVGVPEDDILSGELHLSSPERAFLESLDDIIDPLAFNHIDDIIDYTWDFRPDILNTLLLQCRKSYIRRMLCLFGDRHNPPWWAEIDTDSLDLTAGSRVGVESGVPHPRFNIQVPEDYARPYEPWY